LNSTATELRELLQIQKTYLSNICQQLRKSEYQNDAMNSLKKKVETEIESISFQLSWAESDMRGELIMILTRLKVWT
jgi:hypothetical protein